MKGLLRVSLLLVLVTTGLFLASCIQAPVPENGLTVYFLDIGQGDAVLIDNGNTEVLIDGGGNYSLVQPFLQKYVDGKLEVMVATHAHADHIGGLTGVLNSYEVEQIWHSGDTSTSKTYITFIEAVNNEGAAVHTGKRGDLITTGNLSFEVLNPDSPNGTSNNNSLVLWMRYGNIDFLFEGDAEEEAEKEILMAFGLVLRNIEILKLGHHGSRTASSPDYLAAVHPAVAIYMAGKGNTYGHPHQETLTNLENIGARILGTDVNGTISVSTDGQIYTIQIEKAGIAQAPQQ